MRVSFLGVILFFLTIASFSPSAFSEEDSFEKRLNTILGRPQGLTAEEVAQRAMATSFALEAKTHASQAAKYQVIEAAAHFIPQISARAEYDRLSAVPVSPSFPVNYPRHEAVGEVTFALPLSDYALRLVQAYKAVSHSAQAARLEEKAVRLSTATNAKITYYNWIRAQALLLIAEQSLEQAREQTKDVEERHRVGTVLLADLLQTRSQLKSAELRVVHAQNLVQYTADALRITIHDPTKKPLEIGEDVRENLPPLERARDLAELKSEALDQRLEVRIFDANLSSQEQGVRVLRAGYFPVLQLLASDTDGKPNSRIFPPQDEFKNSWAVGAQVKWTPTDIPAAAAGIAGAKARLAQTRSEREALLDAIQLEVTEIFNEVHETLFALESTAKSLEAAEEAYRVRHDAFRVNKATLVELTDSETKLTQARLEAINARVDLRTARAKLLHAVGRDLAD